MTSADAPARPVASARRRPLLLLAAAVLALALVGVAALLHARAPRWWPQATLRHAPNADMALRAALVSAARGGRTGAPPAELRRFRAAALAALIDGDRPSGHRAAWALCGRATGGAGRSSREDGDADAAVLQLAMADDPALRWLAALHARATDPVQGEIVLALAADRDPRVAATAVAAFRWAPGVERPSAPWTRVGGALAAAVERSPERAGDAAPPSRIARALPDPAWMAGIAADRGVPAFADEGLAAASLRLRVTALAALVRLDVGAALAAWHRSDGDEPERLEVLRAALVWNHESLYLGIAERIADGAVPQSAEAVVAVFGMLVPPAAGSDGDQRRAAALALARIACGQGPAATAALRRLRALEDIVAADPGAWSLATGARDLLLWQPGVGAPLASLMRAAARGRAADAATLSALGIQLTEPHAGMRLAAAAALAVCARRGDTGARALLERRAAIESHPAVRAEIAGGLAPPPAAQP